MISGKLVRAKARILGVATLALALSTIAVPATAQPYPSRSITILVGYSAGGQADALARIIGKQLGENLKVSVVIENKTGANGMIAAQAAARAEPDGHTILMVTDVMVTIDPHLATSNHFDLSKAMEPVINVAWSPLLLAAANNVPANSLAELVALGKQKTQNLSFGSPGSSTPHRLAGEMLQKYCGFTMTHIPYKGTAASVNDLLGGQIPLLFGPHRGGAVGCSRQDRGARRHIGKTISVASRRAGDQRDLPAIQGHQLYRVHASKEYAEAGDRCLEQGGEPGAGHGLDARLAGQAGHGRRRWYA